MIQEYTLNGKTLLGIEVSEDAYIVNATIEHGHLCYDVESIFEEQVIPLPPGSYQILGRVKDITAKQIKGLPHSYAKMYRDYESERNGLAAHNLSEIESFLSFCKKNNIGENVLLIIKLK